MRVVSNGGVSTTSAQIKPLNFKKLNSNLNKNTNQQQH
jgi:hypothetical protein